MRFKIRNSIIGILMIIAFVNIISSQQNYQNQYYGSCPMMSYGLYGGYGTTVMIVSWVISILIIVFLGLGIFYVLKNMNKK